MEARQETFLNKILKLFTDDGFGVEKFDDNTFDIVDRSVIGSKAKCGSIKITKTGDVSIRLPGESAHKFKFKKMMPNGTSMKVNLLQNVASTAKGVKAMLNDYKKAAKSVYESVSINGKGFDITRDELENAISDYFDHVDAMGEENVPVCHEDLLTFLSDTLHIPEDELDDKYGNIIDLAIDYDEDKYINAMDKAFFESEIKGEFRNFLKENINVNLTEMIKNDRGYLALRKSHSYYEADEEGKYRILWKYAVSEFGDKFDNEEELSNICHEIASDDEESF